MHDPSANVDWTTIADYPRHRRTAIHRLLADVIPHRPRRVALLVAGIIVLSVADLLVTLAFLHANSMVEANPIAAYLIRVTQSAWVLAAYKALTVLICVALIFKVRKHLAGEVAAWCAMGILTVMAVMWAQYSEQFDDPQHITLMQMTVAEDMHLGLP